MVVGIGCCSSLFELGLELELDCRIYNLYRSGAVCLKCSSSGPRPAHRSGRVALGVGSEGLQWAGEGVEIGCDGALETTVQRQCVRAGAAWVVVDSKKEMNSGAEVETSIFDKD